MVFLSVLAKAVVASSFTMARDRPSRSRRQDARACTAITSSRRRLRAKPWQRGGAGPGAPPCRGAI
eukprot:4013218-Pyramimonas_sp.AAC.1